MNLIERKLRDRIKGLEDRINDREVYWAEEVRLKDVRIKNLETIGDAQHKHIAKLEADAEKELWLAGKRIKELEAHDAAVLPLYERIKELEAYLQELIDDQLQGRELEWAKELMAKGKKS